MRRRMLIALSLFGILFLGSGGNALAGKDEARDILNAASLLAGVAAASNNAATKAAGEAGLKAQAAGLLALGIWDSFAANPDSNHGVIASVTPAILTPVIGSGQLFSDLNTSLMLTGQLIDDSRLLDLSLRRYFGALDDANAADAVLQGTAASQFLFALEAHLLEYRNSLTDISAGIQGTPFASLSTTVPDVLAFRDQVIVSGFPPSETLVFSQVNATPGEMNAALQELAMATGNTITGSDLSGAVIFDRYSAALGEINLRELLPSGFNVVPEPSTFALLGLGLAGLAGFGKRRAPKDV